MSDELHDERTASRRRVLWGLAGVALLLGAFIAWRSFAPRPLNLVPVPANNAYDDLVAAARRVHKRSGWWNELEEKELAEVVAANAPLLVEVHAALQRPSVVPIERDRQTTPTAAAAMQYRLDRLSEIRELSRAMLAAIRQAEGTGDLDAARGQALDLLQLAQAASYGGFVVDYQVGTAITTQALESLDRLSVDADEPSLAAFEAAFASLTIPAEPTKVVVDRDVAVRLQEFDFVQRLSLTLSARAITAWMLNGPWKLASRS